MSSSRCAACKHLRRRCPSDCIFSPYFPSNNPRRFAYVHKVYGASNVGKILQELPVNRRGEAAESLYYEAYCRVKDPVYGCVGIVTALHQQIYNAQCQLAMIQAEIAAHISNNYSATNQYSRNYIDEPQLYDHHHHQQLNDDNNNNNDNIGAASFIPAGHNGVSNPSAFYDLSTWLD